MPSEEVMYLTINTFKQCIDSTKIKPGTELACLDKKGNNFFFIKLSHGHKSIQIFFLLPMFQILAAHLLVLAVFQVT